MLAKITTQNKYLYVAIAVLLIVGAGIFYMLWRDRQTTRAIYTSTDKSMEQLETATNNTRDQLNAIGSQLDRAGETISSAEGTVSNIEGTITDSEVSAGESKSIATDCLERNREMQRIIADVERTNSERESSTKEATLAK